MAGTPGKFNIRRSSITGAPVASTACALRRLPRRANMPSPFHVFSQFGGGSSRPCGSK
jgi:hypothetical protein